MLDGKPTELSVALDIADKAIKLIAVMLGGIWTYWNYRKSRPYEQKMELQLTGSTFERNGTYIEVRAKLKNLGETNSRQSRKTFQSRMSMSGLSSRRTATSNRVKPSVIAFAQFWQSIQAGLSGCESICVSHQEE